MSKAFESNTYAHWLKALSAGGITFGVISRPQDVPHDEQAVACGAVVETKIPDLPRTLSNPIRLGFAEQRAAHPAPKLGQHSEEILREVGLEAREIAALKATGAVK
jgi:formyl-CoA transferase